MSLHRIQQTGRSTNRVDMVLLAEGYRRGEESQFVNDATAFAEGAFSGGLLSEPFDRYGSIFNIHGVFIVSEESGADRDQSPGQQRVYRDTALNASYAWNGAAEQTLYIDTSAAGQWSSFNLAGTGIDEDIKLASVNATKYGGGGGTYAVWASGNDYALELALHEIGHAYAGLGDTYSYGGPQRYTGRERHEANLTTEPTGAKWEHWLGYEQPGVGVIGAYEGAGYSEQGLYRPSPESKMRTLDRPFDAVEREAFVLAFYEDVDPLDHWSFRRQDTEHENTEMVEGAGSLHGNASLSSDPNFAIIDPAAFSIATIDPALYTIDWYLEGAAVEAFADQEYFDLEALDLAVGEHTLEVFVEDSTDWVRGDRSSLQQSVSWQFEVTVLDWEGTVGSDRRTGGDGTDRLAGGDGDDWLFGSFGDDAVMGGNGADSVFGGDGADNLSGGAGADLLVGQRGADTLLAGDGDDRLFIDAADTEVLGGDGRDQVVVSGYETGGVTLDLWLADVERAYGGVGDDTLTAEGAAWLVAIWGRDGDDTITGGALGDVLRGEAGDDTLNGGYGNDLIEGGAGADRIEGGDGSDRLYGGAGADVFIFATNGDGNDRVFDFEDGVDKIGLTRTSLSLGAQSVADLDISDSADGSGAIVRYETDRILLLGISADQLNDDDFLFL